MFSFQTHHFLTKLGSAEETVVLFGFTLTEIHRDRNLLGASKHVFICRDQQPF